MKYTVEYTNAAVKQLKKMDKKIVAFMLSYIEEKLVDLYFHIAKHKIE